MLSYQCSRIKNNLPIFFLPLFSLILGIYWQKIYACSGLILLICTSIILLVLFFLNKKKASINNLNYVCYLLCFFCGASLLKAQKENCRNLLAELSGKKLQVIGYVENKIIKPENKELLQLSVSKIKENNNTEFIDKKFNLLCYIQKPTKINIGDKIYAKNIFLNKPKESINNSLKPSFCDYLIKENILTTIFTKKLFYKKIYRKNLPNLKEWLIKQKNHLYEKLKNKIPTNSFSLFSTIFLGNKKEIDNSLKKYFEYWGISHYLARSGLHIVLFILLWSFFFNLMPINITLKRILLIAICTILYAFSFVGISFLRAFFVFILNETGKIFKQQTSFLHVLSLACFIILLFNPIQLFFLDFQLSFLLTFALSLSCKFKYVANEQYT